MKKKFYPGSFIQILSLFFFALLITTPLLILEIKQVFSWDIISTILFIIVCLTVIGTSYFINIKRQISVSYIYKINESRFIPQMILLLIIFNFGVQRPINYFINEVLGNENFLKNPIDNLSFSLGAIILAPLFEEIIFRGIVLRGLLSTYSPKKAIIYSAVIFGIIHGKPLQIWGAMVIGLFFGWIYYKTKNIGVTILLHLVLNLSVLLQSYYHFNNDSKFLYSIYITPIALTFIHFLFLDLSEKMKDVQATHIEQYKMK